MAQNFDYSKIELPYNDLLKRSDTEYDIDEKIDSAATPSSISGSSVGDLWIDKFIKSRGYKPKTQGFYLDGATGYAEFSDVYVRGNITVSSIDLPDTTTTNSFHVDSNGNTWWGANVATGYTGANAYILNTGVAKFKSVTLSDSVVLSGLQAGSDVDGQYLTNLSVAAASIANLTITAGKITNNTITANQIANNTITASEIASTTITANEIANNTITATQIAGTTITANEIVNLTITAGKIANLTITNSQISNVAGITASKLSVSELSAITANLGTITAGIIKVSTNVALQKSDTTAIGYLGQDPGASGIWGFIAERGYGLMCRYTGNNYGRIFVDTSSPYPFVINMPSTDRIFITDNANNFIANFYGRTSGLSNLGGLDMFGPIRLLTTNTPPTGASNGMMFYHTTWDEVWVYKAGAWKALAYVP